MPSEYEKAQAVYHDLAKRAAGGDHKAHQEKAQAMLEIRKIEREAARAGTILSATHDKNTGKIATSSKEAPAKRSLQEAYVRKFQSQDGEPDPIVQIQEKAGGPMVQTTLAKFHSKRLLGK